MGRLNEVLELLKKFNPGPDSIRESALQFIKDVESAGLDSAKNPSLLETVTQLNSQVKPAEHPSLSETLTLLTPVERNNSQVKPVEHPPLSETLTILTPVETNNSQVKPVEHPSLSETLTGLNSHIKPAKDPSLETINGSNTLERGDSDEPGTSETPERPIRPETSETPERPETPIRPDTSEKPETPIRPDTSEKPETSITPATSKSDFVEQNDDFFNKMENMFDNTTIDLLFIHNNMPISFDEFASKFAMNKDNIKNHISNKEKLRQIFDYFRNAGVIIGGSLSLIDFKFLIKNKISEIRPKISQ